MKDENRRTCYLLKDWIRRNHERYKANDGKFKDGVVEGYMMAVRDAENIITEKDEQVIQYGSDTGRELCISSMPCQQGLMCPFCIEMDDGRACSYPDLHMGETYLTVELKDNFNWHRFTFESMRKTLDQDECEEFEQEIDYVYDMDRCPLVRYDSFLDQLSQGRNHIRNMMACPPKEDTKDCVRWKE